MSERGDTAGDVDVLLGLGPLESEVMSVVWSRGQVTVGDVVTVINEQRPVAYTTVMTIMSRLATKGLLRRELSGRAHVYEATRTVEEHRAALARDKVRGLLRDFGDLAVVNFVAEMENTDPERLRRLAEFLDQRGNELSLELR